MDFNKLVIRLGENRLLDLSDGKHIVTKLNETVEDSLFKVEQTGIDMRGVYESQPPLVKRNIDACEIVPQDREDDVLEDIERATLHLHELKESNERVIEARLKAFVYIALSLVILFTGLYRVHTIPYTKGSFFNIESIIATVFQFAYDNTQSNIESVEGQ